jgi:hypothetical protein
MIARRTWWRTYLMYTGFGAYYPSRREYAELPSLGPELAKKIEAMAAE